MTKLIVAAIPDRTERRVAEAVLALTKEFHGKPVVKRKDILLEERITEDVYKDRRPRVLHHVGCSLARQFRDRSTGLTSLCVAGNYRDPALDVEADLFGQGLAELPIRLVSGYTAAGQRIGRAMVTALEDKGVIVDEDRVTEYAREVKHRWTPPGAGRLIRVGRTQEQKRHRMLRDCDVVALFGGGAGTAKEARIAEDYGIAVVPLPWTGGAAHQYWQAMLPRAGSIVLGRYPVDPMVYAALGDPDLDLARRAAFALIQQALGVAAV
ncbi:hypothetical protein [Nocardia fluminea]|uniref:hypothetical protein n=1 Tax=Nocardia fluminea TaxID=134984 RepID=UPI003667DEC1